MPVIIERVRMTEGITDAKEEVEDDSDEGRWPQKRTSIMILSRYLIYMVRCAKPGMMDEAGAERWKF